MLVGEKWVEEVKSYEKSSGKSDFRLESEKISGKVKKIIKNQVSVLYRWKKWAEEVKSYEKFGETHFLNLKT